MARGVGYEPVAVEDATRRPSRCTVRRPVLVHGVGQLDVTSVRPRHVRCRAVRPTHGRRRWTQTGGLSTRPARGWPRVALLLDRRVGGVPLDRLDALQAAAFRRVGLARHDDLTILGRAKPALRAQTSHYAERADWHSSSCAMLGDRSRTRRNGLELSPRPPGQATASTAARLHIQRRPQPALYQRARRHPPQPPQLSRSPRRRLRRTRPHVPPASRPARSAHAPPSARETQPETHISETTRWRGLRREALRMRDAPCVVSCI
jgi:hypothetical protein